MKQLHVAQHPERGTRSLVFPVAVLVCLALGGCGDEQTAGQMAVAGAGFPVSVVAAETADYQPKLHVIGSTRSDETVDITSTVTETIEAIHFEDGQEVQQGDALVTLSRNAESALRDQVRLAFEDQQRELQRLRDLRATNSVSQTDFDRQETAARVAELRLIEVESQIADRVIRAPFSGTVGLRELSVGALVSPGVRITTLDKSDPLKVDFRVPATQLDKIRNGARIVARATHQSTSVEGRIVARDSRVTAESRTVEARALLPNPDGDLLPGMLVRVTVFGEAQKTVRVPEQAVLQIGTSHYVFRVPAGDTVVQSAIELVGREPGWAYVSDGVTAGELVVLEGIHSLRDGQKVVVREESGADL